MLLSAINFAFLFCLSFFSFIMGICKWPFGPVCPVRSFLIKLWVELRVKRRKVKLNYRHVHVYSVAGACVLVSIQYTNKTDGQTDKYIWVQSDFGSSYWMGGYMPSYGPYGYESSTYTACLPVVLWTGMECDAVPIGSWWFLSH